MTDKSTYQELEDYISLLKADNELLKQAIKANAQHSSDYLLRVLSDSVKDAIVFSIDTEYCYTFFNKVHKEQMKSIYGVDIVLGMNILDCIPETSKEEVAYNYSQALSGISHSSIRKYGSNPSLFFERFFNPIFNDEQKIIGATVLALNVSDRVMSKQSLVESNELHRAVIANIDDVIGIVGNDRMLGYVSDNIERLFGWVSEEVLGKDVFYYIHSEDMEMMVSQFEAIQKQDQANAIVEFRFLSKDNSYIWVELKAQNLSKNPSINGILISFHNISERKNAEQILLESEQTFRALFEKGPIGVAYHQMLYDENGKPIDYRFLSANASYQTLTGANPSGKLVTEVFPDIVNDPFDWIGEFGKVAKEGGEVRFQQHLSSNDRWYDCVGYQYKPDHFVAAFLEITKQKRAEQKLKDHQGLLKTQNEEYLTVNEELHERNNEYTALNEEYKAQNEELLVAKEKAEESDNLKTAFLQNMSHEIRTPMNAICGFSEMLNDKDLTEEKRDGFVSIITNSSRQLLSIVTDILTISSVETKQEEFEIEKTNINFVMNQLLTMFKPTAIGKNIALTAHTPLRSDASYIFTDKTKITQVLTNLLTNALKFTSQGSIEFGYTQCNADELEFYVKDTGIGIKPEHQEKIFDRFRQADSNIQVNYGGTGLGLAISKGFVELLSGKIWLESEIGKGSIFHFTIPYVSAIEKESIEAHGMQHYLKKVLIAEDETYNFMYVSEVLSGYNLQILHARNGVEAIEICKSNPDIHLVLMDIKMPVMDGYEAAKNIRTFMQDIVIIALSAFALENERRRFEDGVFDDYLSKPITPSDIKEAIARHIHIQ